MAVSMESIKTLRASTGAGIVDCRNALEACNGDIDAAGDWLREKGISKAAKKASRIAAEGTTSAAVKGDVAVLVEVNSETDFSAKSDKFKALVEELTSIILDNEPKSLEEAMGIVYNGDTVENLIVNATATIGEKISLRRFEVIKKSADESFGYYIHMGGKISSVVVLKGAGKEEIARDVAMHAAALAPTYLAIETIPAEVVKHEHHIQEEAAKNDPKLAGKPAQAMEKILEGKVRKSLAELCLLEQDFVKDPSKKVAGFVKENGSAVVRFVRYATGEGLQKREDNFAEEVMAQIK